MLDSCRHLEDEGFEVTYLPADAAGRVNPADLARALRLVLEQGPDELAAMRERCLAFSRERYNWESAAVPYLELVDRLVPPR